MSTLLSKAPPPAVPKPTLTRHHLAEWRVEGLAGFRLGVAREITFVCEGCPSTQEINYEDFDNG